MRSELIIKRIIRCARGEYGYVLSICNSCGNSEAFAACGCGDRNCPNCGKQKRQEWVGKVSERFLPERAFHIVFTLPHEFNIYFRKRPTAMMKLLTNTAAQTLLEFSADEKYLGGVPFMMTVLHTWTQELHFHPHIHALISAGGMKPDGSWHESRSNFLFPVRALSKKFRGLFLSQFAELATNGSIELQPEYQRDIGCIEFLAKIPKKWVVHAKRPYKSVGVLIRYFARYANRTAISDARIVEHKSESVTIKCRRDPEEPEVHSSRLVTMPEEEFIFRFAQHIPPKGFHRIRYYGLMSPRMSEAKREHISKIVPRSAGANKKVAANELPPPHKCSLCQSEDTTVTILRANQSAKKREDSS
jgi:hypothetical protein